MIVFRGSPDENPLIPAGAYVSPHLERAASYARYPRNGDALPLGYISRLDVAETDIDWEPRDDCVQGVLKGHFQKPLNLKPKYERMVLEGAVRVRA